MIRFYNGRVLTFSGGTKVTEGEVWTDGKAIGYVGPEKADRPSSSGKLTLMATW